jgi:hypothetical protein
MLSLQQQKVVEINNITTKQIESGEYVFLIAGRYIGQSPSFTQEGAIKKGIGYVMSRYRK